MARRTIPKIIKITDVPTGYQRTSAITDNDRMVTHQDGKASAEWFRPSLLLNALGSLAGSLGSVVDGSNDKILIYDNSDGLLKWVSPSNALPSGVVTEAKIGSGAVTETKIGSLAVVASKIDADAVTESKILNGAVTVNKIGTGAVTSGKIGNDQVDSQHYAAGSIDTEHLSANAVTRLDYMFYDPASPVSLGASIATPSGFYDSYYYEAGYPYVIIAWANALGSSDADGAFHNQIYTLMRLYDYTAASTLEGPIFCSYGSGTSYSGANGNFQVGGTGIIIYSTTPGSSATHRFDVQLQYGGNAAGGVVSSGGMLFLQLKK